MSIAPLARIFSFFSTNNRVAEADPASQQQLASAGDGFQTASVAPAMAWAPFLPPDIFKWYENALRNLGVVDRGEPTPPPYVVGPKTTRTLREFESETSTQSAAKRKKKNPYNADKGTPFYNQHDRRWGNRRLGRHLKITNAGCAMTATAMAISKISGHRINPKQLDHYLDTHHGYYGDALNWDRAARSRGLRASRWGAWSTARIDKSLKLGRPVCIGVNYKRGSNGGPNGTDHWITITARKKDKKGRIYYVAHDPGTGRRIKLYKHGQTLRSPRGAREHYNSTRQLVVFYKPHRSHHRR